MFYLGHMACLPPSTGRLTPVLKLASSEARNEMALATWNTYMITRFNQIFILHLSRLPWSAEGVCCLGVLEELLVALGVEAAPLLELGHDHPGVDGVHSDLLGGQLQSHTPGELVQRGLGNIVGQHA